MTASTQSESVDLFTVALALGRIEEKVSGIVSLDERVRKLEQTVERIEAKQGPKAPWYVWPTSIVAILTSITLVVTLFSK